MEYAENRSLNCVLKSNPPFWNAIGIGKIVCGIVMGMKFIHSRGFIHRDLKPSNILVTEDGHALISGFGTSCRQQSDYTRSGEAGTLHYAAPEMFEEVDPTAKVDVFRLSQTAFEILRAITRGDMPNIQDKVLPSMKSLIQPCWALKPDDRPTFEDIFQDLKSNNFEIVADADISIVRGYVAGVQH
jgi:serine/threonine protein kinase